MIASLSGTLVDIDKDHIVIDVHGIGFDILMPAGDISTLHIGQELTVKTSLAISQDAFTLYGFTNPSSKKLFTQLQKVSGIGPKVALGILSTFDPEDLAQAITKADVSALCKAPGVGRKGAQKIILELQGTLVNTLPPKTAYEPSASLVQEQLVTGLTSLGWSAQEAQWAAHEAELRTKQENLPDGPNVAHMLQLALSLLDRRR